MRVLYQPNKCCDDELTEGIGRLHRETSRLQRQLLAFIREYDHRRLWEQDGATTWANGLPVTSG